MKSLLNDLQGQVHPLNVNNWSLQEKTQPALDVTIGNLLHVEVVRDLGDLKNVLEAAFLHLITNKDKHQLVIIDNISNVFMRSLLTPAEKFELLVFFSTRILHMAKDLNVAVLMSLSIYGMYTTSSM
jgi:hypothetical protein